MGPNGNAVFIHFGIHYREQRETTTVMIFWWLNAQHNLTVWFFAKRLLSIVTNNRICKCLCASSHRCCFSPLNEQNTQHNRVFEWFNIEYACSKWLLKPHRDAFKTIISHESLVIFKNTTTSAKNFKHFMDSTCIEKKKCAQQKGNNWKYDVAKNERESNSNRDSSEQPY